MRKDAKLKKLRISFIVSGETDKPGFEELLRGEVEMDTVALEALRAQTEIEPMIRSLISHGSPVARRRIIKAKLDDPPPPAPKLLPPGPAKPPKKGGNGKSGAN